MSVVNVPPNFTPEDVLNSGAPNAKLFCECVLCCATAPRRFDFEYLVFGEFGVWVIRPDHAWRIANPGTQCFQHSWYLVAIVLFATWATLWVHPHPVIIAFWLPPLGYFVRDIVGVRSDP